MAGASADKALVEMQAAATAARARAQQKNQLRVFEQKEQDWKQAEQDWKQKEQDWGREEERARAASALKNAAMARLEEKVAALQAQEERVAELEDDLRRKLAQIDAEAARKRSG